MAQSTDTAWESWGRTDPYFGVVSWPEFHKDRIGETREAFFATGRREVEGTLATLERLYGPGQRGRVLDFGCGVGRLVREFSHHFDEAVGVDISEAMLAEARANTADIRNVSFALSDDALSQVKGSFDLVHSYIVLQHIPVSRGLALIERLLEKVRPGGTAALHVSLERTLSPAREAVYRIKHQVPLGRQVTNVLQRRPWDMPAMEMNEYSLTRVLEAFGRHGFEGLMMQPEFHSVALTARIFGRRTG